MRATFLPRAGIISAKVTVVAKRNIVALHQVRLVHLTVTVVVQPIADLRRGDSGIAFRQAVGPADPLTVTGAKVTDGLARGRE